MLHAGRSFLSVAALALGVLVVVGNGRDGPGLADRVIVLAGLCGLVVWAWNITGSKPAWLLIVGVCAVCGWLVLTWSWATPVDSSYGSCGSPLARQQPAGDTDASCDRAVAHAYNATLPLMLVASAAAIASGLGATLARRRHDRAAAPSPV